MSKARICNLNYFDINTLTSLTYSSQDANFPVSNLYNYERRSKVWRSDGCTSEWLRLDMGTAVNPKAIIIIGIRNKPIPLTGSAVVKLQGNSTDVWTSPAYEKTLTLDDRAIVETSTTGLHTTGLRYWRIIFADSTNPLGYIEIGQIYLGDMYETTRGAVQFPFGAEYVDHSDTSRTEGGQIFSDIKQQTMELSPDWFGLTIAEKEVFDAHFEAVGTARPWFIQLDPDLVYSTSQGIYTKYVRFTSAPRYSLLSPGVFRMDMNLREEL